MPVLKLYQERKQKDLKELAARVAEVEAKHGGGGEEAAGLVERLQHRYQDARSAFARLETAGDSWEELIEYIDAAFRNVYLTLERINQRLG